MASLLSRNTFTDEEAIIELLFVLLSVGLLCLAVAAGSSLQWTPLGDSDLASIVWLHQPIPALCWSLHWCNPI